MKTFDIRRHFGNNEDTTAFLNSKAKDFYNGTTRFASGAYRAYLKSVILDAIVDIERVIKGVFNCDLFMKCADYSFLCKMFPNATKLFGINSQEDVLKLSRFLETLRNASAHAQPSSKDYSIFSYDFALLKNEKRFNDNVYYENKGNLTVAGLLFIVLNFLREESITITIRQDNIFAVIACGERSGKDVSRFINEISKTNLEIPIRTTHGDSIISAICGKYYLGNDKEFAIRMGSDEHPTFKIDGDYSKGKLTIKGGSLSKTYYLSDYVLIIKEEESFIKLANSLPPMALVDLLYLMGVGIFDKEAFNRINDRFDELYSKINYPKFYIDKTIGVLLLPKTNADYRMTSSIVAGSIIGIMNNLEDFLLKIVNIDFEDEYSRIGKLLHHVGLPDKEMVDAVVLRNFGMHGYSFGEYQIFKGRYFQFTLDFTIKTLNNLLVFFSKKAGRLYDVLAKSVSKLFIQKLCSAKYKKVIEASVNYVKDDFNLNNCAELTKKNDFVNHSFYDMAALDELNTICYGEPHILKVEIDRMKENLYFYAHDEMSIELLNKFIARSNMYIKKEYSYGVLSIMHVGYKNK